MTPCGECYRAGADAGGPVAEPVAREVLPFYASLLALVSAALLLDALLHLSNAVWIGRYLGIPGTILILISPDNHAVTGTAV